MAQSGLNFSFENKIVRAVTATFETLAFKDTQHFGLGFVSITP
jgi:hypothetical protein